MRSCSCRSPTTISSVNGTCERWAPTVPTLSTSHPNPWDYLTRVPIIASGADIAAGATNEEVIDIAALAPTYAEILGMDFDADSEPLAEVVDGINERPKLIFTVVIDGGGWNVLQQHPESWPFIQSLRDSGITYTNANIGSAPSITGALHATMGTGVYPEQARDSRKPDAWTRRRQHRHVAAERRSHLPSGPDRVRVVG